MNNDLPLSMLTDAQFDRARNLALRLAGIELLDRHRELLRRRCQRRGLSDGVRIDSLLDAVEASDPTATRQMVELLATKHTGFFRHSQHFEFAAEHLLRTATQRGSARAWSAAAATGEEPYSLAMVLVESFGRIDPPVTILATDIEAGALAAAAGGEYSELAMRAVEPGRRAQFFFQIVEGERVSMLAGGAHEPGGDGFHPDSGRGKWEAVERIPTRRVSSSYRISAALRQRVEFRPVNLAGTMWSVEGPFDVILCRNVLMYLESCHRYAVLERMASMLAPDGFLILDPTEHLGKAAHLFSQGAGGFCYPRRVISRNHGSTGRRI